MDGDNAAISIAWIWISTGLAGCTRARAFMATSSYSLFALASRRAALGSY